jgi:hypothetical protein
LVWAAWELFLRHGGKQKAAHSMARHSKCICWVREGPCMSKIPRYLFQDNTCFEHLSPAALSGFGFRCRELVGSSTFKMGTLLSKKVSIGHLISYS